MWSWSEKVLGNAIGQLQARPKQLFNGCSLPWEYDYQHYKLGPVYMEVWEGNILRWGNLPVHITSHMVTPHNVNMIKLKVIRDYMTGRLPHLSGLPRLSPREGYSRFQVKGMMEWRQK